MKPYPGNRSTPRFLLPALALAAGLALPLPSLAGPVALATSPLATSTTSTVKPNITLVLDDSGSMAWDHMPDDASDGGSAVTFSYGYYGVRGSQCNEVYYDPTITYLPPIDAAGVSYANAIFSGAWTDGFKTSSGTVDLRTGFTANQAGLGGNAGGTDAGGAAYYYSYSGTQTTQSQKNYNGAATTTFVQECSSAQNASPGQDVFTKISLSPTAAATTATIVAGGSSPTSTSVSGIIVNSTQQIMSGTAAASATSGTVAINIRDQINACTSAKAGNCTTAGGHGYTATVSGSTVTISGLAATATALTVTKGNTGTMTFSKTIFPIANATQIQNFANWYSYYRARMLMMKTATGRAFGSLNQKFRVGFMKLSSSSTPTTYLDTFWNNADSTLGPVSTQRTTWYNAVYAAVPGGSTPLRTALSNAGRYYAGKLAGADPLQYSCQQNFAILSTDGYWNTGNPFQLDGSTALGNQDGTAGRPMYDGGQADTTVTTTYTRNSYSSSSTGCSSSKKRLVVQSQIQSCGITTIGTVAGAEVCTAWSNTGSSAYVAPYTSSTSTCTSSVTLPSPNPTARAVSGTPVTTPGTAGGSSDSLADVAMYYYQTDLRTPALNNCTGAVVPPATTGNTICSTANPDPYNNVFMGATDKNQQQHMNVFTLGLGASGWMNYSSSYLSDTSGDYFSVKLGATANSAATPPVCPWQANGTVCNWPLPGMDSSGNGFIANVDDLWHAAVNGRGAYFSATNPTTLAAGLSNALTSINAKIGSAAAAATSTLNPVAGNNFAYVASYTTVLWQGNLEARGINVDTGVVDQSATWCVEDVAAQSCALPGAIVADTSGATTVYNCVTPNAVICNDPGVMVGTDCQVPVATACTGTNNALVTDTSDTRTIETANSAGTALINFDAAYAAANPASFAAAKISALSQWSLLTAAQQTAAAGANLVNYLRGQHGHEFDRTSVAVVDQLYRNRQGVLGDALESQPAFIGAPVFSYPYPGYSNYLTAQAGRAGTVYMGANDGMMHAFAADTGVERWAYVPSVVIPNMWKLADTNYSIQHANLVNGSPTTSDICTANCANSGTAVWKTILVAGLNGGGRGYYALDITVPTAPVLLWEFTPAKDSDLGYTYGQPVITRKLDGTWVVLVTSGYDNGTDSAQLVSGTTFVANSPAGSGKGYLYVLNASTGAIISKISTGVGTAAAPSGLAKIAGWNNEPAGNTVSYTYGGDLLGNVWRFDINSTVTATIGTGAVLNFATLFDAAGTAQPITTTPVLGTIVGKRVVFIGTGKYLETGDLTTTQKQTQYAIKDDNATSTLVNPRTTLVQQFLINNPNGTATRLSSGTAAAGAATASNTVNFFTGRGWYVDFPDTGERVNIDSKLVQGTLLVPTIVPSNTVCSPGGFGWLNFFDYTTGGSVTPIPGIPLASGKYDATIVGINVLFIQGSPVVEVVTSINPTPTKDPDVAFKATSVGFTGKRVIWRELIP
jgi:type IV pilus assembly protein PilY1